MINSKATTWKSHRLINKTVGLCFTEGNLTVENCETMLRDDITSVILENVGDDFEYADLSKDGVAPHFKRDVGV